MVACRRVQALVGQHQSLDRFAAENMRVDDFIDVGFADMAIPDRFRVNDYSGSVLALIEAAGLIGPYSAFKAALG